MNWKALINNIIKKIDRWSSNIFVWALAIAVLFIWTTKVFIEFFPFILIISLPFLILFDIWIGFFYIYYIGIFLLCGYRACYELDNHQIQI